MSQTIAFIGRADGRKARKAGHNVLGFDLVGASRQPAAATRVEIRAMAIEAASAANVVIIMLLAGHHVLSVWSDLMKSVNAGTLLIDCAAFDVERARKAHAFAEDVNGVALDAPVSGGTRFAAALMLKDLKLAQQAALACGAPTQLGAQAAQLYRLLEKLGHGSEDSSAIIRMCRERNLIAATRHCCAMHKSMRKGRGAHLTLGKEEAS